MAKVLIFASGKDGSIRELVGGRSRQKFETGFSYSQLRFMHGGKAFFAGVANSDVPGAIHVVNYPFEEDRKVQELQVHQAPVCKLALNYEHSLVFSGAEDGSLAFMVVADRPKGSLRDMSHIAEVLVRGRI